MTQALKMAHVSDIIKERQVIPMDDHNSETQIAGCSMLYVLHELRAF